MNEHKDDELLTALGVTAEVCGTQLAEGAALVMQRTLSEYPHEAVLAALDRCRRELTGRLSLAAILERIETGHPGTEEAWAMFPKTEEESAIVTGQMMAAASVAMPLYDEGDVVGARMAWKEIYPSLVAKADGPPEWVPTLGTNKSARVACLTEGVRRGQIPAGQALANLGRDAPEELLALAAGEAQPQLPAGSMSVEDQQAEIRRLSDELKGRRKL